MFELVKAKLLEAGYDALTELDGLEAVDMHGIGLTPDPLPSLLLTRAVLPDEVDEDPQPVPSPADLFYEELQARLLSLFTGYAPKGFVEHKAQAESVTDEQLVVMVEYMRRNMQWGCHGDEVTSYEQAMRNVWLPELLRRFLGEVQS